MLRFVWSTIQRIRDHYRSYVRLDFTNRSASLAFYTILSIFPLLLVVTSLLEYFVPRQTLQAETMRMLGEFFPLQSRLILSNLNSIFEKKTTFGWFGVLGLLFGARMIYLNLERIVNELLHTDRRRHFLVTRLFLLVWLIGTMAVLVTPLAMGALKKSLLYFDITVPAIISSRGIFILSAFLMFLLLVTILPTTRIRAIRMVMGGLLFSAALGVGQLGFKAFANHNLKQYNLIYGSLSSAVLGAVWIFYFYQMFLLCVFWTGWEVRKTLKPAAHTGGSTDSLRPAGRKSE